MRVRIENLGAVKKADLEIKPLTVFIGPSGTGKTWTAYAISAMLGTFGLKEYLRNTKTALLLEDYPPLNKAIKQMITKGSTKFDIIKFSADYMEKYLNHIAKEAKDWLSYYLGTQKDFFKKLNLEISLEPNKKDILDYLLLMRVDTSLGTGLDSNSLIKVLKEASERIIYFITEGNVLEKIPETAIQNYIVETVFQIIQQTLYSRIYTFITERSTFVSDPLSSGHTEATTDTNFVLSGDKIIKRRVKRTPAFINNFNNLIGQLYEFDKTLLDDRKNDEFISPYLELASTLENQILKGNVHFSASEPILGQELFFEFGESKLEVQATSSMVKELAVLVLYLRYLARPNDLIIIDEPEMNLHPEAQARMAEFLAMLVNANLNVWVTTHSSYIVDHLVNLMKAAKNENQDEIASKFYLKSTDAFISQDEVAVYLFDEGTAKNILDERAIIDWATFSKVSDQINEIFFSI